MLLFDENDTSDWQDSIREAHLSSSNDEQQGPEVITEDREQPDTDVPGVWRCQVEPKSHLYGNRSGKLLDQVKTVKGRLNELKQMNDHHVFDWIHEPDIPNGTKIETARWLDDIKPVDGDDTNVRSRIVVQQLQRRQLR